MSIDREVGEKFRRIAPPSLIEVCDRLRAAGHRVVIAGGAVRDLIIGRGIEDWDLATSALPGEVAALFERTTLLHAQHGVTQVRSGTDAFEVTAFRVDGPYSDGRHPDFVRLGASLEEDLARRDFTVNALALDPHSLELIDPQNGCEDLDLRVIRTVGDPALRFREDALRLMRAARFAATLEFGVDPATRAAMTAEAPGIDRVSGERIRDELMKMLAARLPSRAFEILHETGLLARILPELDRGAGVTQNEFHAHDVFTHSLLACDGAPVEKPLVRLTALLHDVGKVPTRAVREDGRVTFYNHEQVSAELVATRLERLRFSRRDIDQVTHLVRGHMFHYEPSWSDAAVRRFISRVGLEAMEDLFDLRVADLRAKTPEEAEPDNLDELRARIDTELAREQAFRVRDLAVNGDDLKNALGLEEGPEIGRLLQSLLDHVIDRGGANTREELLARARELRDDR